MSTKVRYSIIIPMFNEEEVIQETYRRIKKVMGATGESYELLFVNDGSTDNCAQMIEEYSYWDESVKLIDLSRNFGHQIAITAGMDYSLGDAVVIIDADLQDPPELILDMIAEWKKAMRSYTPNASNETGNRCSKSGQQPSFTGCSVIQQISLSR